MQSALKIGLVVAILALLAGRIEAGAAPDDRIHVSRTTNVVTLPGTNSKQTDWEKFEGPDAGKAPGQGPTGIPFVAPSSPVPLMIPNQRFQERMDQQRNWIFQTPDMLNQGMTAEEALNVREIRMDGQEGKPKKTVERYLESADRNPQPTNRLKSDSFDFEDRDHSNPFARMVSPAGYELGGSMGRAESTLSNVFDLNRLSLAPNPAAASFPGNSLIPVEASLTPILGRDGIGRLDGFQQRQLQADERFQRLLRPGDYGPSSGGLKDPINLFGDTTAKELQPVTANRISDLIKGNNKANWVGSLQGDNSLGRPLQAGILEDLNRKVLGPSSLSPAMDLPVRTPSFQPMPVVSELPRRKF